MLVIVFMFFMFIYIVYHKIRLILIHTEKNKLEYYKIIKQIKLEWFIKLYIVYIGPEASAALTSPATKSTICVSAITVRIRLNIPILWTKLAK